METYSKEGQDILVSKLISKPGFFLDIGCAEPIENNNTYLLERNGWRGILLDSNQKCINECKIKRSSFSYCLDVTKINWLDLLKKHNIPKVIDYISMDADDANIEVMQNFPFNEYEFKIMTYETDLYSNSRRQQVCEQILSDHPQYIQFLKNAQLEDGKAWEDWWINKNYFDKSILDVKSKNMYWKDFLKRL